MKILYPTVLVSIRVVFIKNSKKNKVFYQKCDSKNESRGYTAFIKTKVMEQKIQGGSYHGNAYSH